MVQELSVMTFINGNSESKDLKRILEKILTPEILKNIDKSISFSTREYDEFGCGKFFYNYPMDETEPFDKYEVLFEETICTIIDSLKKQIEIIDNIPDEAIVLPEDVIVYRGVNSLSKRSEEIPTKSLFMSTSTRPEMAKLYGGKNCYIYKTILHKGTPVLITPYKVINSMVYGLRLDPALPSDPNGTKEIILKLDSMKDFKIIEEVKTTPHYDFKDGEFIETERGYIITGKMEPKTNLLDQDSLSIDE